MKLKEMHVGHIVSAIIIVLAIFVLTQIFPYQFTMQYLDEDMNLVTETFDTKEGFNERANELKADSVFYWLHHE